MPLNRPVASVIPRTPANPILLAWTLARRRRVRRLLGHRDAGAWRIATAATLGVSITLVSWRLLRVHGVMLLAPLQEHLLAAGCAAAAIGGTLTARSRRRVARQLAQSWLASAPVAACDELVALRWGVVCEVGVPLAGVLALIACAGAFGASTVTPLLAAVLVGFATGAAGGWHVAGKPPRRRASAWPRLRPSRPATSHEASVSPLGRLPFAQWRAGANPGVEARLLGALLLSLPMGIPPVIVLLLLAIAASALAALTLLRATLATIPAAADWLRATPLGLGVFVRTVSVGAGTWQIAFALLGGALAHALGASTGTACLLIVAWLAICATALASAFACRHHWARLAIELMGIGGLLAALAGIAPLLLALAIPALWAWQATRMRNA